MTERDLVEATHKAPATVSSLTNDFRKLGIQPGMTVLVHSSLSKLGWVCGGEVAVIQALHAALGPEGTFVVPTHTAHLSDPTAWQNPPVPTNWWEIIKENMPAYDPAITPSRKMGAIAECFRKMPGVIRSDHPHTSFAAHGPKAELIIRNHQLHHCLGEGSPLARLYDLDAWVLLLGVDHTSNTSIHLAEYRANYKGKDVTQYGAPVSHNGQRKWVIFEDINNLDDSDFDLIGEAFAEESGLVIKGKIAEADAFLFPQRPLVDFAVKYIEKNR
jgi:aminoglycoside 3-N-acetyltransferase